MTFLTSTTIFVNLCRSYLFIIPSFHMSNCFLIPTYCISVLPFFSFILVLWSLRSPAGSNNKHSTLDFLQATQLKGQDPSPGHKIYNSLTLKSAGLWKTEPCAKIALACKMYNCLTLMCVVDVNKRGN